VFASDALRGRLTYANAMATGAMFVALGGGAYALTGAPDSAGVFHGCVSNKTGVLRVAKSASACHKARVRGRRRDPGEFAVSWNQQGPRGIQGIQGTQGTQGVQGIQGPPGTVRRAYGYIASNGTLDTGRSANLTVAKITGQSGAYCVRPAAGSGIDPTTVRPVVSADLAEGVGSAHTAQISSYAYYPAQCPSAAGWEIYTQRQDNTYTLIPADAGFSIVVP
jgi:hypothetical protein